MHLDIGVFYSAMGIQTRRKGVNPFELVFWRAIIWLSQRRGYDLLESHSPFGPPEVRGLVLSGELWVILVFVVIFSPLASCLWRRDALLSLLYHHGGCRAVCPGELIDRYKAVRLSHVLWALS